MSKDHPYKLNKRLCCICGNESGWDQRVFKVPNDEQRLRKWMELFNREDILELDPAYVRNCARVCAIHFHDWAFASTEKKRLIKYALPNIPGPLHTLPNIPGLLPPTHLQHCPPTIAQSDDPQSEISAVEFAETIYEPPEQVDTTSHNPLPEVAVTSKSSQHQVSATSNGAQCNVAVTSKSSQHQVSATSNGAKCNVAATSSSSQYKYKPPFSRYQISATTYNSNSTNVAVQVEIPSVSESQAKPQQSRELQIIKNQKAQICVLKKKIERIRMGFMQRLKDNWTAEQYEFLEALIKQGKKSKYGSKYGTRYEKEVKEFALKIYSQSPKLYKMLQEKLALPSRNTLRRCT